MNDQQRFRITVWPGTVVEPPPVRLGIRYRFAEAGEVIVPLLGEHAIRDRVPLGGETYLRAAEVDLDSPDAILRFVNDYGIFAVYGPVGEWAVLEALLRETTPARSRLHSARVRAGETVVEEFRQIWASNRGFWQPDDWDSLPIAWKDPDEAAFHDAKCETLEEFRFAALTLRDMIACWRYVKGDINLGEMTWTSPGGIAIGELAPNRPHVTDFDARDFLRAALYAGMSTLRPGLRIDHRAGGTWTRGPEWRLPVKAARGAEVVPSGSSMEVISLYTLCCLELYNHIVDDSTYRVCGNEPCGRLFVRQRGRAKVGQYRSKGLKYCSHSCAKAQAQRDYRRRQRRVAEKRGGPDVSVPQVVPATTAPVESRSTRTA